MEKIIGYDADAYYDDLFRPGNHLYNGAQFTKLCRELLGSPHNLWLPLNAEYITWPQSDGIADGGIDIIAINERDRSEIFFQCKHKVDRGGAEATLKKLCATLETQLISGASRRYLPWKDHPVNTYVICLSCGINQGILDEYTGKLKEIFSVVAAIDGMQHLEQLKIVILYDAIFHEIMENDFLLSHKWLNQKRSVEPLVRQTKKTPEKFTDFLDSEHLGYFSRKDFKATLPVTQAASFEDEDELLDYLSKDGHYALIIFGQGGAGKTRLTLELGWKAKDDYTVLKVKSSLKTLDELLRATRNPGRYLLLFDYIEEQPVFMETLRRLAEDRIANIRIVANCRTSFHSYVKNNAGPDSYRFLDTGSKNEQLYKTEIVRRIISTITDKKLAVKLKYNKSLHAFCQQRPAFAVFVKYLNFKNPGQEHLIGMDTSFEFWVMDRLKLTLTGSRDYDLVREHKHIFMIMSCLPTSAEVTRRIKIDFLEEISTLIKDGWIDEDSQALSVVHDTVNDILLSNFLNAYDFDDVIIEQLLFFALKYQSLSSMFRALERVWTDRSFVIGERKRKMLQKQIAIVIRSIIDQSTAEESWFSEQLAFTQLIGEADRTDILFEHRHLLERIFARADYGHSISYTMNWVENTAGFESINEYKAKLKTLFFDYWNIEGRFDHFAEDPVMGGRITSTYINLFGIDEYISGKFDTYLAKVPCQPAYLEYINFAIVAWLTEKKEATPLITELLPKWVNLFLENRHDYFNPGFMVEAWVKFGDQVDLIRPLLDLSFRDGNVYNQTRADIVGLWLERGDDPLLVKPFITPVLESAVNPKSACYIMGFWLEFGDEPLLVKPFLAKWLDITMEPQIFSFIFKYWLRFGDDPELIVPALKRWCLAELNESSIAGVLQVFLDCGGRGESIKSELLSSLQKIQGGEAAVYLLGFWLEQIADPELFSVILPLIPEVLDQRLRTTRETAHILTNWIRLGGQTAQIEGYLVSWLELYNNGLQAGILIRKWLEFGHPFQVVKRFIVPFLSQFVEDKGSTTLVFNWLRHGDEPLLVKDYIKPLAERFAGELETRFLISNWLELAGEPELVKGAVTTWLDRYCNKSESVYIASLWTTYGNEPGLILDYIKHHFDQHIPARDSNYVIESWLNGNGDHEIIRSHVIKYLDLMVAEKKCIGVAYAWLHAGGSLSEIGGFIFDRFDDYGVHPESAILLRWCLNSNYEYEVMLPLVLGYLERHTDQHRSVLLINAWLRRGFPREPIETYVQNAVENNERNLLADHFDIPENRILQNETGELDARRKTHQSKMIVFHLKSGEDPELISCIVKNHLREFGTLTEASHVLSAWIEYGNDFELAMPVLVEWLKLYALMDIMSSFLIGVTLEHADGFSVAEGYAIAWFKLYGKSPQAKFVLSSWLKNESLDPARIDPWIDYWMTHHFVEQDANVPLHWRDQLIWDYYQSKTTKR